MNLQVIKSADGTEEYVLLPIRLYHLLRSEIERILNRKNLGDDRAFLGLTECVNNPVALARLEAGMTQTALAKRMQVTQAYISRLEAQNRVTAKVLKKVKAALK